jgi:hypothetical protein
MHRHGTHYKDVRDRTAEQTHNDLHPGSGVVFPPTHDEIAHRAFDIYVRSGCEQGHCKQNWHEAEHELLAAGHQTVL